MKTKDIVLLIAFVALGLLASISVQWDGYGSFESQMVLLGYLQVAWLIVISVKIEGDGR